MRKGREQSNKKLTATMDVRIEYQFGLLALQLLNQRVLLLDELLGLREGWRLLLRLLLLLLLLRRGRLLGWGSLHLALGFLARAMSGPIIQADRPRKQSTLCSLAESEVAEDDAEVAGSLPLPLASNGTKVWSGRRRKAVSVKLFSIASACSLPTLTNGNRAPCGEQPQQPTTMIMAASQHTVRTRKSIACRSCENRKNAAPRLVLCGQHTT